MSSARSGRLDRKHDRIVLAGLWQMHLLTELGRADADVDAIVMQRDPVDELGDELVLAAGCAAPERGCSKIRLGECVLERGRFYVLACKL